MRFREIFNILIGESTSQEISLRYLRKYVQDERTSQQLWKLDQTPSKGDIPNIVQLYKQSQDLNQLAPYLQKYYNFKKKGLIKNLDSNFVKFTERIDALEAKRANSLQKVKVDRTINPEDVLVDNEDIQILKAHSPKACIQYGAGYSFCISRPGGGNLYHSYRSNFESTFYFIFFKKIPKSDPTHIMVLDRTGDGWKVTHADNDTQSTEWENIVEEFPILKQYEELFVNNPLTDEENKRFYRVHSFKTLKKISAFNRLSYGEKAQALSEMLDLPNEIFNILDSDLRNEFISSGANLTKLQANSLTPKEIARYQKVRTQVLDHLLYLQEYKFNILDVGIPSVQERMKKDYERAQSIINGRGEIATSKGRNYAFMDLLITELPDLSKLTEEDELLISDCPITSLKGCPKKLWSFACRGCGDLENLEGGPEEVKASYTCNNCGIKTLKGSPKKVGLRFYCLYNYSLENLEGGPQDVGSYGTGLYNCSGNLLESLKGAPKNIVEFDCSWNHLTSLKDGPERIYNRIDFEGNDLTDTENVPLILPKVGGKIKYIEEGGGYRFSGLFALPIKIAERFVENLNRKIDEYISHHPEYTIDKNVEESVFPKFDELSSRLRQKLNIN